MPPTNCLYRDGGSAFCVPGLWVIPVLRLIHISDLSARSSRCCGFLRTLHHPAHAQVLHEFRFQHSAARDE